MHKKSVKIGRVVPEIWSRTNTHTDRQTDGHAHHNTPRSPIGGGVINHVLTGVTDRSSRCWEFRPSSKYSAVFTRAAASSSSLCTTATCSTSGKSTTGPRRSVPHGQALPCCLHSRSHRPLPQLFFTFFAPSLVGEWRTGSLLANETEVGGWSIV